MKKEEKHLTILSWNKTSNTIAIKELEIMTLDKNLQKGTENQVLVNHI